MLQVCFCLRCVSWYYSYCLLCIFYSLWIKIVQKVCKKINSLQQLTSLKMMSCLHIFQHVFLWNTEVWAGRGCVTVAVASVSSVTTAAFTGELEAFTWPAHGVDVTAVPAGETGILLWKTACQKHKNNCRLKTSRSIACLLMWMYSASREWPLVLPCAQAGRHTCLRHYRLRLIRNVMWLVWKSEISSFFITNTLLKPGTYITHNTTGQHSSVGDSYMLC